MKRLFFASLVAACTFIVVPAFAAHYSPTGKNIPVGIPVSSGGPTSLTYAGFKTACHSTFFGNVPGTISGTAATINSAQFKTGVTNGTTDSSLCPHVTANGVWRVAKPTSANGPNNVTITNISITIPNVITCTGSVTGTLTKGYFNFTGNLQAATGGTCAVNGSLKTTLTAVYP